MMILGHGQRGERSTSGDAGRAARGYRRGGRQPCCATRPITWSGPATWPRRCGCPAKRGGPRSGCTTRCATGGCWSPWPRRTPGVSSPDGRTGLASGPIQSVTAARSAAVAALGVIVAFHRAEQALMTQVGYGIGDISTAEKRQLASGTDLAPPTWPDSSWGRVAAAAWHGRCDGVHRFPPPGAAGLRGVGHLPGRAERRGQRRPAVGHRVPDLPGRPRGTGRPGRPRARGAVVRAGPGPGGRQPCPATWKAARPRWPRWPGAAPIRGPRRTPAPSWSGCCSRPAPCTNGAWAGPADRLAVAGPRGRTRASAEPGISLRPGPSGTTCSGSATRRAISAWPPRGTGTGVRRRDAWQLSRRVAEDELGHDLSRIVAGRHQPGRAGRRGGAGAAGQQPHLRRVQDPARRCWNASRRTRPPGGG